MRKARKNPAIDPNLLSQEKNAKAIMEAYEAGVRNFRLGDFSGMYLEGMDFSGSNLELADFTGANLQGADFQNARLEGANFAGANLANASFAKANLEDANLERVDATSAYFEDANLSNASFMGSDLRGSTFKDATLDQTDFRNSDLRDAHLETPYIGTVDFRGAKIEKWPQIYAEAILTGEQVRNPGPKAHEKNGIKMMKDARKAWDRYCKKLDPKDALDCFEMLSIAHQELSYVKDKKNLKEVKQGLREVKAEIEDCLKAHKKKPEESDMGASMAAQMEQALDRNPLKRGQKNPISASEIKKIRRAKLRKAMKARGVSNKSLGKVKRAATRSKIRKATKNPITDGRKIIKEVIAELNDFQIRQLGGKKGAQAFAEELWESADLSGMPMRDRKRWIYDHMMSTAELRTRKATKNPRKNPSPRKMREADGMPHNVVDYVESLLKSDGDRLSLHDEMELITLYYADASPADFRKARKMLNDQYGPRAKSHLQWRVRQRSRTKENPQLRNPGRKPKRNTAVAKRNPDGGYNGWEVSKYMAGPPHQWAARIRDPNSSGLSLLRTVNECTYELKISTVDSLYGSFIQLALDSGCDPEFYELATISVSLYGLVEQAPKFQLEELLKEATSWANERIPKKQNPSKRSGSGAKGKKTPRRSKKKVIKARRNPGKIYGHQFKVNEIFPEPSVQIVTREEFINSDHGLSKADVTELMRMREDSSMVVGGLEGGPMYSVYRGKHRDPSLPYEERLQPIAGEFEANPGRRPRQRNPGVYLRTVQKQIERLDNGRLVLKRDELRDHLASMKDAKKELGPAGYEMASKTLKMYEAEIKSRGLKTNPAPKGKLTQKQAADFVKKEKLRLGKLPKKYYPMWVETYESAKGYYGDKQTAGRVAWSQVKKYCEKTGEKWVCGPLPKKKTKAKKKS